MSAGLDMFTIYERPRDHPAYAFVVRRSVVYSSGEIRQDPDGWGFDTIEAARASIPPGRVRIPRHPSDDPMIVESWF